MSCRGTLENLIPRIHFLPDGGETVADGPADLAAAAADCGIVLELPCAGTADCGSCRVRVLRGAPAPTAADRTVLGADELAAGWRLGCRLVLADDAIVDLGAAPRLVPPKAFELPGAIDPDREPVRAVVVGGAAARGLALDIGTTSLAAAVVDLVSGEVLASRTCLNPQVTFGADVMTRIQRAIGPPAAAGALQRAVRGAIAGLVEALGREAGIDPRTIADVAVVGNPTMMHLWLGLDVSTLGHAPFDSRIAGAVSTRARDVDCPVAPAAPVYVLPGLRCHVGGDAVAAAVAVDLDRRTAPALLMDLGTNSELFLAGPGGLLAASTAAGPAFEGAGISCGMRAEAGAIDAVWIREDGTVVTRVIGQGVARGLCGSGVLDAVAELRRRAVIDRSGYLRSAAELLAHAPDALRARIVETAEGRAIVLDGDPPAGRVTLSARDIRQAQLAIAAMRAGTETLMQEAGVRACDLETVFVAGTFGQVVRAPSLTRLGLVPVEDPRRVRAVGNAAGVAARLALLDARVRRRAEAVAATARHVDLARGSRYAETFANALTFPESIEP